MHKEKGFAPIVGIVVALLVVVGGGYVLWGGSGEETTGDDIVEGTSEDSETMNESNARTLRDLIAGGQEVKCTFTSEDEHARSSGTVYVSGGDVRGDFVSVAEGVTVEGHMIETGGYVYTWSNMLPQGFKMQTDTTDLSTAETGSEGSFNYDGSYEYDCDSWSRDDAMFTPPGDVTFMDPATMFTM